MTADEAEEAVAALCDYLDRLGVSDLPARRPNWRNFEASAALARAWSNRLLEAARADRHGGNGGCPLCGS